MGCRKTGQSPHPAPRLSFRAPTRNLLFRIAYKHQTPRISPPKRSSNLSLFLSVSPSFHPNSCHCDEPPKGAKKQSRRPGRSALKPPPFLIFHDPYLPPTLHWLKLRSAKLAPVSGRGLGLVEQSTTERSLNQHVPVCCAPEGRNKVGRRWNDEMIE